MSRRKRRRRLGRRLMVRITPRIRPITIGRRRGRIRCIIVIIIIDTIQLLTIAIIRLVVMSIAIASTSGQSRFI